MTTPLPGVYSRAYLADMDGVLLDSTAAQLRGWARWAAGHGLPAEPFVELHGWTAREKILRLAPHLDAVTEAAGVAWFESIETDDVTALPGAVDLLTMGPDVAVVTSGTRGLAIARFDAARLPLPTVLITAESVQRGKPDPEGYLLAARVLGRRPVECTVIEDAPAGVQAGRAAGMTVVGVTTTHCAAELHGAHVIAGSVAEYFSTVRI